MKIPSIKKAPAYLFILLVYIGIPLSILAGVIDFNYKFHALTIGAIIVYIFCRLMGFTHKDLGITLAGARKSIMYVLPVTGVLAVAGVVVWLAGFSRITPNENWYFFIFYIFISSPFQEFLYRGALEALMEREKYKYAAKLIVSSLLYSFVHVIYRDWLTLALTFAIGLIWYYCYEKKKSLVGVSVSHAVLGIVTIVAGIID